MSVCDGWHPCCGSAARESLKTPQLYPVSAWGALCLLFVGTMCLCCLFPCVPDCEMFVCVSPASSSSPSGAPASLLPLASLDCDRSQLTPPLLWQPESSLEKGQLATFCPACPAQGRLCGAGAPSVGHVGQARPSQPGFLSNPDPPEASAGLVKGLREGNDHAISHSN